MSYPRTIKNFNAFLDGISYFGIVKTGKLPMLKLSMQPFRGAGMDAPKGQDMGMDAMKAELAFFEFSEAPIRAFGSENRIVLRPVATGVDPQDVDAWVFTIGGTIEEVSFDDQQAGTESLMKVVMDVDYFAAEKNGVQLFKIDVVNGVRIIDGVDQLGAMRRAMGI